MRPRAHAGHHVKMAVQLQNRMARPDLRDEIRPVVPKLLNLTGDALPVENLLEAERAAPRRSLPGGLIVFSAIRWFRISRTSASCIMVFLLIERNGAAKRVHIPRLHLHALPRKELEVAQAAAGQHADGLVTVAALAGSGITASSFAQARRPRSSSRRRASRVSTARRSRPFWRKRRACSSPSCSAA